MIGTVKERREELNTLYPAWTPHTLWTRFNQNAQIFGANDYLVFDDKTYSYEETRSMVLATAKGLWAIGVRPGNHVAVLLRNCPEYVFLIYALSLIGAVKVPVIAGIQEEELSYVLKKSDAGFLITGKPLSHPLFFPDKTVFLGCPCPQGENRLSWEEMLYQGTLLPLPHNRPPVPLQNPLSVSDIMFTSGSTSRPKGVMLTHDMLLRSAYSTCLCRCFELGRRIMVPIPLYHAFAYVEGLLAALFCGGAVIMTRKRFDVEDTLRMMREHRANDVICVSVIMHNLLLKGCPQPEDYPHLHSAYWASACADWIWEEGRRAFGITDICTSYGMTECGSTTVMITPEDLPDCVHWCNGKQKIAGCASLPGAGAHQFFMKVCDPGTGRELPPDTAGELCCKGATISPGYYRQPEANALAFDAGGWFHTGDLVRVSPEGYLTFLGRINDMYKINGENVSPQFIDSIIGNCPLVKETETVGVFHPKYGEVGLAFIELTADTPQNRQKLYQYCREHLASFQVPRYYCFSSQSYWPHTSSDKISKTALRRFAQQWINVQPSLTEGCELLMFRRN